MSVPLTEVTLKTNSITTEQLKALVEAAIFVSEKPLSADKMLHNLFAEYQVNKQVLINVISEIQQDYQMRGVNLIEVASGYRFQARADLSISLANLFQEKTPKYSRALLETLALIAYKQPITRGEIEDIRGVAVSSYIIKTLVERNWLKTLGQKEVPGRPTLYGTTKEFLDYFSLTSLKQLPPLITLDEKQTFELS